MYTRDMMTEMYKRDMMPAECQRQQSASAS